MPYIIQKQKAIYHDFIEDIKRYGIDNISVGELNYLITKILQMFIDKPSYTKINAAIGVLECAKLELYRRIAAPYEDEKIEENGDVY